MSESRIRRQGAVAAAMIFCLAWSSAVSAVSDLRGPRFMAKARQGFTDIYNLDYDQAEGIFRSLQKEYPGHPAPPLYLATIIVLRTLLNRGELSLGRFVSPSYFTRKTKEQMEPEERKSFFDYIRQSQALSEDILKERPGDLDARYFLGASYGILAAFAITIDHSLIKAFQDGNEAYRYEEGIIKEDPHYYDAYLAVGLYQYIVGSLPWYLKWLAEAFGYSGSVERGIEYLQTAVEKGKYVTNDARVLLMVIYVREKEYGKALEEARVLHEEFSRNYLFAVNEAQIYQRMGNIEQASSGYLRIVRDAEQGVPNYDKIPLGRFHYQVARQLFAMGRLDEAQRQLEASIADPKTPLRDIALSHLLLGKVFDLLGRRKEAVEQYRMVLKLGDYDDSHREAGEYLRTPYAGHERK